MSLISVQKGNNKIQNLFYILVYYQTKSKLIVQKATKRICFCEFLFCKAYQSLKNIGPINVEKLVLFTWIQTV